MVPLLQVDWQIPPPFLWVVQITLARKDKTLSKKRKKRKDIFCVVARGDAFFKLLLHILYGSISAWRS
jgi:hypothetical protein